MFDNIKRGELHVIFQYICLTFQNVHKFYKLINYLHKKISPDIFVFLTIFYRMCHF